MLAWGNWCYSWIPNCANQQGSYCASCNGGFTWNGSSCVEKYPGKPYVAGPNKYVWITGLRGSWWDAKITCENAGMYLPSLDELKLYQPATAQSMGVEYNKHWTSNVSFSSGNSFYGDLGAYSDPNAWKQSCSATKYNIRETWTGSDPCDDRGNSIVCFGSP